MKSHFSHYYSPTQEELKKLWTDGLIALDANVMLHLYGYSEATQDKVLELYCAVKNRLWVPYQAASEYHQRRVKVITDQAQCYSAAIRDIESLASRFKSDHQHPFASEPLLGEFDTICAQLTESLNASRDQQLELLNHDPILQRLTELLEGRVGDPFNKDELTEIYREGVTRFDAAIPPGFRDKAKPEPDRYGDLIIWKELLRKAAVEKRGVLLVIDDAKDDWFDKRNGRTVGPRVELRDEFMAATGQQIHFYSAFRFVEVAADFDISVAVPDSVKEELKNVQRERDVAAASLEETAAMKARMLAAWASNVVRDVDRVSENRRADLLAIESTKISLEGELAQVERKIAELQRQYALGTSELKIYEGHEAYEWSQKRRSELQIIQIELGELQRERRQLSDEIQGLQSNQIALSLDLPTKRHRAR